MSNHTSGFNYETVDLSDLVVTEKIICGRVVAAFLGTASEIRDAADHYEAIYSMADFKTEPVADALYFASEDRDQKKCDIYIFFLLRLEKPCRSS